MIKRYAHITIGMLASEEGEWVKYEDVENLIKEKSIEQHREEFEAWVSQKGYNLNYSKDFGYLHGYVEMYWEAWKAAKGIKEF